MKVVSDACNYPGIPPPVVISAEDESLLCPIEQTGCELLLLEESDLQHFQLQQEYHQHEPLQHASCSRQLPCPREDGGSSAECPIHHHRIHIAYYSDAIRDHALANAQRLLVLAASTVLPAAPPGSPAALGVTATSLAAAAHSDGSTSPSNNSAMLARKALRYRKIYERMDGVDVTDPRFNASRFLGVTWHKLVP